MTETLTVEELRQRFARKANLSPEHHEALSKLTETNPRPVVLWEMGTDLKCLLPLANRPGEVER